MIDLVAVQALEKEVVAHDGGRLKLEPKTLAEDGVTTALRWDGDRLVGFAARYPFGPPDEIAGMVAPDHRRRGIGASLLAELLPAGRTALLVVPVGTPAGRAFAASRQAILSHSEHYLVLGETPQGPEDPAISLRLATGDDLELVRDLLRRAFDWEPPADVLHRFGDTTQVIEREGVAVGTLRIGRRDDWAGVYGFAVDPDHQGRGIGRDVLARTCRALRADGVPRVTLEVETGNANALRLYTDLGFVHEAGEDYWEVSG
ncbi:MAG: GCN5-related N-acetyltransferase [Frankiales bacterium]|nr:GCN5-related N-acetyltransferase [Frankiales bacterium]